MNSHFLRLQMTRWALVPLFLSMTLSARAEEGLRCAALFGSSAAAIEIPTLLKKNQVQEAAWLAHRDGNEALNAQLEKQMLQRMYQDELKPDDSDPYHFGPVKLVPSQLGSTELFKIQLESGLNAIYKTDPEFWTVHDGFSAPVSNTKAEVDAYRIDRELDLQVVPVTIERELHKSRGSLQVWVESDSSTASVASLNDMKILDYLINNLDRHEFNWLVVHGRAVAIDHGRSFKSKSENGNTSEPPPRLQDIQPQLVRRETYERLVSRLTPEALRHLLQKRHSKTVIDEIVGRRNDLVAYLKPSF